MEITLFPLFYRIDGGKSRYRKVSDLETKLESWEYVKVEKDFSEQTDGTP